MAKVLSIAVAAVVLLGANSDRARAHDRLAITEAKLRFASEMCDGRMSPEAIKYFQSVAKTAPKYYATKVSGYTSFMKNSMRKSGKQKRLAKYCDELYAEYGPDSPTAKLVGGPPLIRPQT